MEPAQVAVLFDILQDNGRDCSDPAASADIVSLVLRVIDIGIGAQVFGGYIKMLYDQRLEQLLREKPAGIRAERRLVFFL